MVVLGLVRQGYRHGIGAFLTTLSYGLVVLVLNGHNILGVRGEPLVGPLAASGVIDTIKNARNFHIGTSVKHKEFVGLPTRVTVIVLDNYAYEIPEYSSASYLIESTPVTS